MDTGKLIQKKWWKFLVVHKLKVIIKDIVDRVNFINSLDMIIIPNYLRVGLEKEFDTKEKIFNNALFKKIYRTIVDIVV